MTTELRKMLSSMAEQLQADDTGENMRAWTGTSGTNLQLVVLREAIAETLSELEKGGAHERLNVRANLLVASALVMIMQRFNQMVI